MTIIKQNYELKNESTFKIGGCAKEVALPETVGEFVDLLNSKEYDYILGNCSNILFYDGYINKKIILTKKLNDFYIYNGFVNVSCGTCGSSVAKECQKNSLSGFEFMIGFPGSFGGMICMNASAHGQSISDIFIRANIYDLNENKIITLTKEDMNFGYRKSVLSNGNYVVLNAVFKPKNNNPCEIEKTMRENLAFRKEKQPSLKYGNAGSIFKNPENESAGKLIDMCGFRGKTKGGAKVFENHANFIINYDSATSSDVINLMFEIFSKVKENYKIELKPEIKYIGNNETDEYKLWQAMTKENIQKTQK